VARFFLTGDNAKGLEYIPLALHELKRMKREGCEDTHRTVMLTSGVTARIILGDEGGDRVYIHAAGGCPQIMFSGFMDAFKLGDPQTSADAYSREQQIEAEQRDVVVPPASTVIPKFYGVRTMAAPAPLALTTKLPIDPGTAEHDYDEQGNDLGTYTATVSTHDFKRIYERFRPSCFTGWLRQIWQNSCQRIILEMIADPIYPGWRVASPGIDYRMGNSFGAIKNNGKYYLIKITTNKVYYIPATFCIKTEKVDGVDTEIAQLISLHKVSPVQIGDYSEELSYWGSSWSDEIGWAFAYTEAEASIVGATQANPPDRYWSTTVHTMKFSFDSVTGQPNSTSLTSGHINILWAKKPMSVRPSSSCFGLLTVPVYEATTPGQDPYFHGKSIDFGIPYPYHGEVAMPEYQVTDIPVYVYYTMAGMTTCTYSADYRGGSYKDINGVETRTFTYKFDDGGENVTTDLKRNPGGAVIVAVTMHVGVGYGGMVGSCNSGLNPGGYDIPPEGGLAGVGSNLAAACQNAWDSWSLPAGQDTLYSSGCETAHVEDQGSVYTDVKYKYISDGGGGGVWDTAGLFVGVQGNPLYGEIPPGDIVMYGNVTARSSESCLTLSVLDREAHLVYGFTEEVISKWMFTNATSWTFDSILSHTISKSRMTLYGHNPPMLIDTTGLTVAQAAGIVMHPTQVPALTLQVAQAAHDPANMVYGSTSLAVRQGIADAVKIHGQQYPIENAFYGWTGVI